MRELEARILADRGGIYSASVKARVDGYALMLETSKGLEALTLQRGGDRVFKTLDAVAALLRSMGVSLLSVELSAANVTVQGGKDVTTPGQVIVTPPSSDAGATARAGGGDCAAVALASVVRESCCLMRGCIR